MHKINELERDMEEKPSSPNKEKQNNLNEMKGLD